MGLRTFGTQLKALVQKELSFFSSSPGGVRSFFLGGSRTQYNYRADVGDGMLSSVVMPTIQFIMRAFPEAPLVVRRRQDDEMEIVEGHPLVQLVERPNDYYPGALLWMATLLDWCWFGESYWHIVFDRGGRPGELWWLPPWSIEPKWPGDGSEFISHYEYHPDGLRKIRFEREEVLHFRHGIDPRNSRHGFPPLRAVLQDIWVDMESTHFTGAILRNMGVAGMIISPKGEAYLSPEDVERIKAYIQSRITGDERGQILAFGSPTDVQRLSFSPSELDLSTWRISAETRVPAALGIPSAVVGFYSGLDATKVGATMREYVRLAWTNGLVPVQRLMASELQRTLLPHFEENPDAFEVGWNYDEVSALEENQNELAKRAVDMYQGGVIMRSEARQIMGYEANDGDKIYLVPSSMTEEGPDAPEPEPLPAPLALPAGNPPANGNGNQNGARNATAQQRSYLKQGATVGDFIHSIIARHAQTMDKPPRALLRLAAKLWRQEQALQPQFHAMLVPVLKRYGEAAATAAREIIIQKAVPQDVFNMSIIHERVPFLQIQAELAQVYEHMYEIMTGLTLELMAEALNVEPVNPERIQSQLRMLAHERVGLLDLSNDARETILRSLDEARVQGLSEDQMVELIKNKVPSGRWSSPEIRAQIVARNETRVASNLATTAYAQSAGIDRVLILDARLGPTDAECTLRNGWVVSPAEGRELAGREHINGTLAILPLPSAVAQTIG